jgi:hypothetical protein
MSGAETSLRQYVFIACRVKVTFTITLLYLKFLTCFGRQASNFRRLYTSIFWCELGALVAVGWLQVLDRLVYTPKHVEDLRHNKVVLKVKLC